jgi:hypothetical protein
MHLRIFVAGLTSFMAKEMKTLLPPNLMGSLWGINFSTLITIGEVTTGKLTSALCFIKE